MRLFFLIPYTPTPIRTRPYHFLRALAARGHAVTLATTWETAAEQAWLTQLEAEGIEVLASRLSSTQKLCNLAVASLRRIPLQARYGWQPDVADQVREKLARERFDAAHVEHLRGAEYGIALRRWMRDGLVRRIPVLWDAVDCISLLFSKAAHSSRGLFGRWVTRLELPRTRAYEGFLVNRFEHTLVTSRVDADALECLAQADTPDWLQTKARPGITVVPNGVDLETFCPPVEDRAPATLVFSGKMSYHANETAVLWLAQEILPQVWARRPEVKLQIVGSAPGREVRELAKRYPQRVEVTGYVEQVAPYLRSATLAVAPIAYGVGIQNKVLEAMACATPVIATSQAASALKVRDGEHLLLAQDGPAFAGAILRVLDDRTCQEQLGRAGRRYVEQNHSWGVMAGLLEQLYFRCAQNSGGTRVGA